MFFKLTKKRMINTLIIGIALPIVTVSCGGGGSGDSAPAAGPVAPTAPIAITSTSAPTQASQILFPIVDVSVPTSAPISPTGAEVSSAPTRQMLINVTKSVFNNLATDSTNGVNLLGATVTIPCDNPNGSRTEPDAAITSGTVTISYDNCLQGTTTTNGSVTLSGSGDSTAFTGSITFNNLTFSDNGSSSFSINGGFNVDFSSNLGVTSFSLTGKLLSFAGGKDALDLKDFNFSFKSDTPATTDTVDIDYTVSSTFMGGTLIVNTITPFESNTFNPVLTPYPYKGVIEVTGANSSFKLTVNPGGTGSPEDFVTLDVTDNGVFTSTQIQWKNLK